MSDETRFARQGVKRTPVRLQFRCRSPKASSPRACRPRAEPMHIFAYRRQHRRCYGHLRECSIPSFAKSWQARPIVSLRAMVCSWVTPYSFSLFSYGEGTGSIDRESLGGGREKVTCAGGIRRAIPVRNSPGKPSGGPRWGRRHGRAAPGRFVEMNGVVKAESGERGVGMMAEVRSSGRFGGEETVEARRRARDLQKRCPAEIDFSRNDNHCEMHAGSGASSRKRLFVMLLHVYIAGRDYVHIQRSGLAGRWYGRRYCGRTGCLRGRPDVGSFRGSGPGIAVIGRPVRNLAAANREGDGFNHADCFPIVSGAIGGVHCGFAFDDGWSGRCRRGCADRWNGGGRCRSGSRCGRTRVNRACVDRTCMGRAGVGWSCIGWSSIDRGVSGIRLADQKGFGPRSPALFVGDETNRSQSAHHGRIVGRSAGKPALDGRLSIRRGVRACCDALGWCKDRSVAERPGGRCAQSSVCRSICSRSRVFSLSRWLIGHAMRLRGCNLVQTPAGLGDRLFHQGCCFVTHISLRGREELGVLVEPYAVMIDLPRFCCMRSSGGASACGSFQAPWGTFIDTASLTASCCRQPQKKRHSSLRGAGATVGRSATSMDGGGATGQSRPHLGSFSMVWITDNSDVFHF